MFRDEAIEHHCRDPESLGVIETRPRWTWPVIAVSAILILATIAYVCVMPADLVHALQERLLR